MPQPTTTAAERLKELERELEVRERVYPGWVENEKISQKIADHRIQILKDLIAELKQLPKYQQPEQVSLFAPADLPAPHLSVSADRPKTFYS